MNNSQTGLKFLLNTLLDIEVTRQFGQRFIFAGGACSILHEGGEIRNPNRDELLLWLEDAKVYSFDPQIDQITHGMSYNYDIHGPAEQAAREHAEVTIYEINPFSYAGVSMMEAVRDASIGKKVIIWFTGEDFDDRGRPLFKPFTKESNNGIKNANNMRKNLATWFQGFPNVKYCRTLDEVKSALAEMMPQAFEIAYK